MKKTTNSLISDNVLNKIHETINGYEITFRRAVHAVKTTFRDRLSSISDVADNPIKFPNDLKKYSNENELFNDEIYVLL